MIKSNGHNEFVPNEALYVERDGRVYKYMFAGRAINAKSDVMHLEKKFQDVNEIREFIDDGCRVIGRSTISVKLCYAVAANGSYVFHVWTAATNLWYAVCLEYGFHYVQRNEEA